MKEYMVRLIEPRDNDEVKDLVITTLAEFGLSGDGYAGVDVELDNMFEAYTGDLSAFYVIVKGQEIHGVGGYAPLAGTTPGSIAELRKMYFKPSLRGMGMGQKIINLCIHEAKSRGYESMYLETVPEMKAAHGLYKKNGFNYLEQRIGDTGHSNCGVYMLRSLNV